MKNLPEIISRVKDNWLGLIALVLVLTAIVTMVIAPQAERKRIVYLILVGAILLVASAFHEAVRQQERLDKAPVVESPAKDAIIKPATSEPAASKTPCESCQLGECCYASTLVFRGSRHENSLFAGHIVRPG